MFLHIGKNKIIKFNDILGFFDMETLNKENFNNLKENHEIIDITNERANKLDSENEKGKTLIILKESDKLKGYITNISSMTLAKRIKVY